MPKTYIVIEEKNEVDVLPLLLVTIIVIAIGLILLYVGAFVVSGLLACFAYLCSVYYRKWKLKRLRKLRSQGKSSPVDISDVHSNETSGHMQALLLPSSNSDQVDISEGE